LEGEEDIRDADAAMKRLKKGEKIISHEELRRELRLND